MSAENCMLGNCLGRESNRTLQLAKNTTRSKSDVLLVVDYRTMICYHDSPHADAISWVYRYFPQVRRGQGAVKVVGVVKRIRRSNSLTVYFALS